ncbi:MAG: hypothetical protein K2K22_08890 [Muribaculaceae bacterium]|nr:hypothetical protein [Muribaculaceae bacterium]
MVWGLRPQPNGATTSFSSYTARRSTSLGLKAQTNGDDKDVIAPPPAKRGDDILVVVRRKAFPRIKATRMSSLRVR